MDDRQTRRPRLSCTTLLDVRSPAGASPVTGAHLPVRGEPGLQRGGVLARAADDQQLRPRVAESAVAKRDLGQERRAHANRPR